MESSDWRDLIQSPLPEYVERFGPLPEGLLKLSSMLTVNTSDRLMADLTQALRVGKPITDWSPYEKPSRLGSASTDAETSNHLGTGSRKAAGLFRVLCLAKQF